MIDLQRAAYRQMRDRLMADLETAKVEVSVRSSMLETARVEYTKAEQQRETIVSALREIGALIDVDQAFDAQPV